MRHGNWSLSCILIAIWIIEMIALFFPLLLIFIVLFLLLLIPFFRDLVIELLDFFQLQTSWVILSN